jgi:hypothetical protein
MIIEIFGLKSALKNGRISIKKTCLVSLSGTDFFFGGGARNSKNYDKCTYTIIRTQLKLKE